MPGPEDILSNDEEQISNEEMLNYLYADISEEEKNAIEQKLTTSSFNEDAMEGLAHLKNEVIIQKHVEQLNQKLKRHLSATKNKTKKGKVDMNWIILAIVFLLFFCIIGFIVINMMG